MNSKTTNMNYGYGYGYEAKLSMKQSSMYSGARASFVSKVYSILSVQLIFTALIVMLNIFSPTFAYIQRTYDSLRIFFTIVAIATMLVLSFSKNASQKFPLNMALLGAFTIAEAYIVASICSLYTPESVLMSAVATAAATFGITFYAMTTKSDFTKIMHSFYAFASSVFWVFLFLSLFNIFVFRSSFVSNVMAFAIALIYCVYILVDTQLILGGKDKELTLDCYVMGAMILYIDIIGLFLKIMSLLGEKKEKRN